MSAIKSTLLNVSSVEVYQWDEARLEKMLNDLNIAKQHSWNKEDIANEIVKAIRSHKSSTNDDYELANEDEVLIDKVRVSIRV